LIYSEKRGDESDGTNRGQGRSKAKERGKKCHDDAQPSQEPKAVYTLSFYWRKGTINLNHRSNFNNMG